MDCICIGGLRQCIYSHVAKLHKINDSMWIGNEKRMSGTPVAMVSVPCVIKDKRDKTV